MFYILLGRTQIQTYSRKLLEPEPGPKPKFINLLVPGVRDRNRNDLKGSTPGYEGVTVYLVIDRRSVTITNKSILVRHVLCW